MLSPNPIILVVEDSVDMQRIVQAQLENQRYEVVCKDTAAGALEWLTHNQPNLVLLDLMLPDMDGMEACRHIRLRYSASILPILMLSALGQDTNSRVQGLQAGANDFLAKPFHSAELVARVSGLLNVQDQVDHSRRVLADYLPKWVRSQGNIDEYLLDQREHRQAVIVFADMRDFTRVSIALEQDVLVQIMEQFYDSMSQIVERYGGTIFDFIGDEILAVFPVTEDTQKTARNALQAAYEMHNCFVQLRTGWQSFGARIGLGIGIHSGEVVLGSVGTLGLRRYSVIGNTVNFAHRMVDLADANAIVISNDVYTALDHLSSATFEALYVNIKGVDGKQTVYQVTSV